MASLLNRQRPPVFCPGCSHEKVLRALDQAFQNMALKPNQIAMVSDIGCSGLFDVFFNTHAFHGLHGRALTYATGLKLARPELNVVVTMGDGGLGIGGAHLLSACRRNLDLTLIVLNNFNFGMTGGQFSATTPPQAKVASGFLNALELPMDVGKVAAAAGATYVSRCSAYNKDLAKQLQNAIEHKGFSIIDTWGICVGRYIKRNPLTPQTIKENLDKLPTLSGPIPENSREEYGDLYREMAQRQETPSSPIAIEREFSYSGRDREEIVILGDAGQRIITSGEILCLAGVLSGRRVSQKNEYNITVLRGPSISEIILSRQPIGYTGIDHPSIVVAIGQEGVNRRSTMFQTFGSDSLVLCSNDISIPDTKATVMAVDFKGQGIKSSDRALASLALLGKLQRGLTLEMLRAALEKRFRGTVLEASKNLVNKVETGTFME